MVTVSDLPGGGVTSPTPTARLMAEGLISLSRAATLFGEFRGGKQTHTSTVSRWCLCGVRLPAGRVVKLEHIRLGNRLATTAQAVLRFVESQQAESSACDQAVSMTPAQASRQRTAASAELDAAIGAAS